MMQDLAMHILELLMNSLEHSTSVLKLLIYDSLKDNRIYVQIIDNGSGMSEEVLKDVLSPFRTSRKTRNVGMGVAFLKSLVEFTNGNVDIQSTLHEGTSVSFDVQKDHIDLPPWGDLGEIIMYCFNKDPKVKIVFEYKTDQEIFHFDLQEIENEIGELDCSDPAIQLWIKDYINEGIHNL